MKKFAQIKGLLLDLDGVLYVGSAPVAGAIEAVKSLQNSGLICRFITNTSTLSLQSLQHKINALGFAIPLTEIISAPQATLNFLKSKNDPICRFLLADDVKKDFAAFKQSDTEAEYIVVGDIGNAWTYQMLNEVFACLMRGAKLIAMHKNRFWQTEHGLQMDIGAYIHGLEYASNTQAMMMGKPSTDFFNIALADMRLEAAQVLMIGDDIDSDIGGAQQAGIKSVLVRTGKYRAAYAEASSIKPDLVLDSVADLPKILL
jgi:HAD superfamily hydrolase (TIGR01458 family)